MLPMVSTVVAKVPQSIRIPLIPLRRSVGATLKANWIPTDMDRKFLAGYTDAILPWTYRDESRGQMGGSQPFGNENTSFSIEKEKV